MAIRMRVQIVGALLLIITGLGTVSAQLDDAGQVEFEMLAINYSPREMAMAGAGLAMPNGLDGFHANPAMLAYVEGMQGVAGYRSVIMDVQGGYVAFGLPLRETGFWSLNIINFAEGSVDEVIDDNGSPSYTGRTWSSKLVAGSVSWARVVWRTLALGVSLKGVYRYTGTDDEYYSADGVALDLGAQYRLFGDRLIFGIAARNLGGLRSSYTDDLDKNALPASLGGGVSYVPRYIDNIRIALDIEKVKGRYTSFEPALEVAIIKKLLFARGGFAFSTRDLEYAFDVLGGTQEEDYQKSQWNTLCLGLGVHTAIKDVDVGLDAAVEFHTVQHASVGVSLQVGY